MQGARTWEQGGGKVHPALGTDCRYRWRRSEKPSGGRGGSFTQQVGTFSLAGDPCCGSETPKPPSMSGLVFSFPPASPQAPLFGLGPRNDEWWAGGGRAGSTSGN